MSGDKPIRRIEAPYVLITSIPYFVDGDGDVWLDRAWHRDFIAHTEYLGDLTLVAPERNYCPESFDLVRIEDPPRSNLRFIGLKPQDSLWMSVAAMGHTTRTLWREIDRAHIVHSGVAGWPIPLGWIANPIALLRKRRLVLSIESAPWRTNKSGLKRRILAWITERLARFFMHRASLVVATQPSYLTSLRKPSSRGIELVNPASWIREEDIVSRSDAEASWKQKLDSESGNTLRFLFVGRMAPEKGVGLVLTAAEQLERNGAPVRIDVMGSGLMKHDCEEVEARCSNLSVLNPVTYGWEFFEVVRSYHAVLVPSLGDEQPRILFDAFSQAVPVIAADTEGIKPYVESVGSGWLFTTGSVPALITSIEEVVSSPEELERRGRAGLEFAEQMTHQEMHRVRSHVLYKL